MAHVIPPVHPGSSRRTTTPSTSAAKAPDRAPGVTRPSMKNPSTHDARLSERPDLPFAAAEDARQHLVRVLAEERPRSAHPCRGLGEEKRRPVDAHRPSLRGGEVDEVAPRGELRVVRAEVLGVRNETCSDPRALEDRHRLLGALAPCPDGDELIELGS